MAGRNTRQRGDEVRDSEGRSRDYELIIKRITQMETNIEDNSKRWRDIVQEMKELKKTLRDKMDREEEGERGQGGLIERVEQMKDQVSELSETIDGLSKTNDGLMEQNKALKQHVQEIVRENEELRERLTVNEERGKEQGENLVMLKQKQEGWVKVHEEKIVSFEEIMKQQEEERRSNLEKQVIQVIKNKEHVVRDMVEKKKSVIIFGLKEKVLNNRSDRVKEELKVAREIIKEVEEDNAEVVEEIEEVFRLGKYEEGKARPMKIKFKSQAAATKVLERTWTLAQTERYKDVWIRKDLNEEERARRNELMNEAKEKNDQRSEEEKNRFYWRVVEEKIKKWYIKREQGT